MDLIHQTLSSLTFGGKIYICFQIFYLTFATIIGIKLLKVLNKIDKKLDK
jgi:hypothetical protein